jgi:hypothetical protein
LETARIIAALPVRGLRCHRGRAAIEALVKEQNATKDANGTRAVATCRRNINDLINDGGSICAIRGRVMREVSELQVKEVNLEGRKNVCL